MKLRIVLSLVVLCGTLCTAACAQEFRVYTRIYDETADSKTPVARALTLFHAGRVYDFIASAGEVIIYEPMQDRFIVLNAKRQLKATVPTSEIGQLMTAARRVARQRVARLAVQPGGKRTADMLAFQLDPKFREEFSREKKTLSLVDSRLKYEARLKFVDGKETAAAYREYADWVSRLNFVLHPRVLLPGPRLVLNEKLAAKQAIPVQVSLHVNARPQIHLRAEHQVHWSLDERDRSLINEWNRQLKSDQTREVSLREYQRTLGINPVSRR